MPLRADEIRAAREPSTSLIDRNDVTWSYDIVYTSQDRTAFRIVLTAMFKPFDFRDISNREYIQMPSNQSDPVLMHQYMDNKLANYIYFTLYNYAPFAFLRSNESEIITSLSNDGAFDEIPYESFIIEPEPANAQTERNVILDGRFGCKFNEAADAIITNNQNFYDGYYGNIFKFRSALNTNMFFNSDVIRNYIGAGLHEETFEKFNYILKVLRYGSAGEHEYDELYRKYILYDSSVYKAVFVSSVIPIYDEDRTYVVLYGNPSTSNITEKYFYTHKSHTPQTQTEYRLVGDGFEYDRNKDVEMTLYSDSNTLYIRPKTNKWDTKRIKVKMKVKKTEVQI